MVLKDQNRLNVLALDVLEDILSDVIVTQAGQTNFQLVESVKLLAQTYRTSPTNSQILNDLNVILNGLSDGDVDVALRIANLSFSILRIAELYSYRKSLESSSDRVITSTIHSFNSLGLHLTDLLSVLNKIRIQLVFAPHPLKSSRLTILSKERKVAALIDTYLSYPPEDQLSRIRIRSEIEYYLTLMWQTSFYRTENRALMDNYRYLMYMFDYALFDTLPKFLRNFQQMMSYEYTGGISREFRLPQFINFGVWVGGDHDLSDPKKGTIGIEFLLLMKRMCIRKYSETVDDLILELSCSEEVVEVSRDLLDSVRDDLIKAGDATVNAHEVYRTKLTQVKKRLNNTLASLGDFAERIGVARTRISPVSATGDQSYGRSVEFLRDLLLIQTSLRKHRGRVLAKGKIADLILKVRLYGFHYAVLNHRSRAVDCVNAIIEVFHLLGFGDNLYSASEKDMVGLMIEVLEGVRKVDLTIVQRDVLSDETVQVLDTLQNAHLAVTHISPRSVQTFLLSDVRSDIDVLATLVLFSLFGLYDGENAYLDIVPMLSRKSMIENPEDFFTSIFTQPHYLKYLKLRGMKQEIYIPYTELSMETGYLDSQYLILEYQRKVVDIGSRHAIEISFFHGRGGSLSRGGMQTKVAMTSLSSKLSGNLKLTEQSEVISTAYSEPETAYDHLATVAIAALTKALQDKYLPGKRNPGIVEETELASLSELAGYSYAKYVEMLKRGSFIKFYTKFTPLDLVHLLVVHTEIFDETSVLHVDPTAWVYSWNLTRLPFHGFYGVGTALFQFKRAHGLEMLKSLYSNWPFFRLLIDNISMVLLKVDEFTSSLYMGMTHDENDEDAEIYSDILAEYRLTYEMVLEITESPKLLNYDQGKRDRILLRATSMDQISLLQLKLLQRWREAGRHDDFSIGSLLRKLAITSAVLAEGLQNTG